MVLYRTHPVGRCQISLDASDRKLWLSAGARIIGLRENLILVQIHRPGCIWFQEAELSPTDGETAVWLFGH